MWIAAAVFSAIFAGLTSIFAKCGIRKTDSDLATALRTIVVLVFSVIMTIISGSYITIGDIGGKSWLFLILSGMATGASWICYFKALSKGDVNKVVPIDKSSTIITVILAIVLFGETANIGVKLVSTALIAAGTYMMIERKEGGTAAQGRGWMIYAFLSAIFAALTSVLAKIGIAGVESNLATAIRTLVVLAMAWIIVFMKGKQSGVRSVDRRELAFIFLSGIATGASWLFYYYAVQNGKLSVVVPIDKMSILITIAFSGLFLHEKISRKAGVGLALMCMGTMAMTLWA